MGLMNARIDSKVEAVVFDVGRVLVEWDLGLIYRDLIPDPAERERFVTTVVTPEWHFQHDAGRPLAEMIPERIAEYPQHEALIRRYASHFGESIPGPVPGSMELVDAIAAKGMPLYAITNFGAEFWPPFHARWPVLRHFRDIVVSGDEKLAKLRINLETIRAEAAPVYRRRQLEWAKARSALPLFADDDMPLEVLREVDTRVAVSLVLDATASMQHTGPTPASPPKFGLARSLADARAAFDRVAFVPRPLVDVAGARTTIRTLRRLRSGRCGSAGQRAGRRQLPQCTVGGAMPRPARMVTGSAGTALWPVVRTRPVAPGPAQGGTARQPGGLHPPGRSQDRRLDRPAPLRHRAV